MGKPAMQNNEDITTMVMDYSGKKNIWPNYNYLICYAR